MKDVGQNSDRSGSQRSSSTSRSLLDRVRGEESEAWDRLVTLYAPLVYYWCRRWDLSEHDVADVFQEVFLAVATHIGTFQKERASDTFRGWLKTITRNKVLDHFRRLGREPGATGVGGTEAQLQLTDLPARGAPDEPASVDAPAERGLFFRGLDHIREEFEPRTWQAFWKTTVDGRAPKDVAADLGMTPGAVRVAKSRVLHRLRDELGDLLE
jgi:RNA polymerase sigma-70 factor (ECF subfamily)